MDIRKIILEEVNDFDWTKDVPEALDWNKLYTWEEMQEFLEDKFRGTRFEIRIDDNRMFNIDDEEGTYHDWDMDEHDTINIGDILDPIKYTCDQYDGSREIRDEYRELYNTIVGYEHYPISRMSSFYFTNESFDWADEISPTPYDGVQFKNITQRGNNIVYTIIDNGGPHVVITWNDGDSYGTFGRGEVEEHFRKGNWEIVS